MNQIDKYIFLNIITTVARATATIPGSISLVLVCVGIYFISSCINGTLINPAWLLVIGLSVLMLVCIGFFAKIKWRQNR